MVIMPPALRGCAVNIDVQSAGNAENGEMIGRSKTHEWLLTLRSMASKFVLHSIPPRVELHLSSSGRPATAAFSFVGRSSTLGDAVRTLDAAPCGFDSARSKRLDGCVAGGTAFRSQPRYTCARHSCAFFEFWIVIRQVRQSSRTPLQKSVALRHLLRIVSAFALSKIEVLAERPFPTLQIRS